MKMLYKLLCVGVVATAWSHQLSAEDSKQSKSDCVTAKNKKDYCNSKNGSGKYVKPGKCLVIKVDGKKVQKTCHGGEKSEKAGEMYLKDV